MYKKNLIILSILLCFLFFFLIKLDFGKGYHPTPEILQPFDPSTFFANLQPLTGTLFIGPDETVRQAYEPFLSSTDDFLHLENYQITYQPFKTAFLTLAQRGIPLHIILEDSLYSAYQNYFKQLQDYLSGSQSVEMQSDDPMGTTYVHSKIMLNEDAFRIQTANLTKSSFESNREHFFTSTNEAVHSSLAQLFENDRKGNPLQTAELHPNLVVCPINCRQVVETLLRSAQHSIIIQTQYILDDRIIDLLRQQSEKIKLNIIVADTTDNADLVQYFGPAVARKLYTHYNHTKMILIDEKYLLLGSMNLSANSLDNNREVGIMLLDNALIQQFLSGFWLDWKGG